MFKKTVKRLFSLLLIAVVVAVAWNAWQEHRYRQTMPLGEHIGPAEDAAMANAVAMALKMINKTRDGLIDDGAQGDQVLSGRYWKPRHKDKWEFTDGREGPVVYRRDVHIKSHGCVKAKFVVPELEDRYRWGVFRQPGEYESWVRYSNGDYILNPDKKPDARGMAVKLMGVPGKKLLPWQPQAQTQDFVMMNSPNYFIRHLDDYVDLTKYLAVGDNFGYFLNGPSWNPFTWRWRELRLVLGTKKKPPITPLTAQYFSASAYRLGPTQFIKFSAKPAQCPDSGTDPAKVDAGDFSAKKSDYNFLRLRMAEQLTQGPACFDFMVQTQVPGEAMPVEDATIVWSEKKSPFVKVATIEIPAQSFDLEEQNQFCEDLSYNPWHSLADHEPVGVFNRVRKALYEEVAKYRWASNRQQDGDGRAIVLADMQPPEPEGWCPPKGSKGDCPPVVIKAGGDAEP